MTELGKKIIELRDLGYSYNKIKEKLGCSKSTISYNLSEIQKQKTKIRKEKKSKNPNFFLEKKIYVFRYTNKTEKNILSKVRDFQRREGSQISITKPEMTFNVNDLLSKINHNPVCYLSGEPINIYEPNKYNLDHIVPATKGGDNSINNVGFLSSTVNRMKSDLTVEEFIEKCKQILEYNGYEVKKKGK